MAKTLRSIDFMVPIRVLSEMNLREHWASRMRRKHLQQEEITAAWMNNVRGRQIELPCVVRLTRIGSRRLDSDNLAGSFKHCQDQIARLLKVDDGDASKVTWEYHQQPVAVRTYGLKIQITSLESTP